MSAGKLHADELAIDTALVRRLLAAQFPQWAALPTERVPSGGTDNALYRLGDDLVVRLPLAEWAAKGLDKELMWLPRLAPAAGRHPCGGWYGGAGRGLSPALGGVPLAGW
jgi:aminoglycoside phosphotransferase (APT) family kinase protein